MGCLLQQTSNGLSIKIGCMSMPNQEQKCRHAQRCLLIATMYVHVFIYRASYLMQPPQSLIANLTKNEEPWPRSNTPLYDIFEPGVIRNALTSSKKVFNLGPLIFGQNDWKCLKPPSIENSFCIDPDPLTCMFMERSKPFCIAPLY